MHISPARLLQLFATPPTDRNGRLLFRAWAALLFVGGGLLWGVYFNWGRDLYTFHDWALVTHPRLTFLQDAVRNGAFPLHIADGLTLGGITDRYLTVPDVLISPQIVLLKWLDTKGFVLANVLLLYAAGFGGLLWLCRRQRLSALALTGLFVMFNFNGHLLAHFTVGHLTWTANFLFPWLVGLMLELLDGEGGWRWVSKVAVLLLVMLLQGGYHQFIWSLFLLGLLAAGAPRHFAMLTKAAVFAVLLSAVRVLPPVMNLGKFDNVFIAGYPFTRNLWGSLIDVMIPNDIGANLDLTRPIGMWEFSLYLGLAGTLFVIGFGVIEALRSQNPANRYAALLVPAVGLTVLSLDRVFKYLRIGLPLPLLSGERVPARMAALALIVILVLAVIAFQRRLDREGATTARTAIWLGIFTLIANDLWQNFRLWRLVDSAGKFEALPFEAGKWLEANHGDPEYLTVLWVGLGISLAALGALAALSRREQHKQAGKTGSDLTES